ncbi:MAG: hypothetical protein NZ899_02270 [Thermoguttaceae bacterium]|nr:hypothetical protein [Thermoguttaceae bacterium]MDW8078761.1 hypothetical protein [Thermoguttaceae bacterium]
MAKDLNTAVQCDVDPKHLAHIGWAGVDYFSERILSGYDSRWGCLNRAGRHAGTGRRPPAVEIFPAWHLFRPIWQVGSTKNVGWV